MLLRALLATLVVTIFTTGSALAAEYEYPASCYNCERVAPFVDDCVVPQNNLTGSGIHCRITTVYVQTVCFTSGGACSYHCTGDCGGGGPGGGSGGGGGGGNTCSDAGGVCPAECFSCGGNYY